MLLVQATVVVVELVQVFNEQVTPVGAWAYQGEHLCAGNRLGLASFELAFTANAFTHIVYAGKRYSGNGTGVNGGLHVRSRKEIGRIKESKKSKKSKGKKSKGIAKN